MFRKLLNLIFGTNYTGVVDLTPVKKPRILKKPYNISEAGINLIKKFEGCRLEAYQDGGGVWTIGYGTTLGIKPGMKITQEQAELYLIEYLKNQTRELNTLLKEVELISQNQFDAISSFVYNIGTTQFAKSTFLKLLKEKNWGKAATQLVRKDSKGDHHGWIYDNGQKVRGLILRRKSERDLFLKESEA